MKDFIKALAQMKSPIAIFGLVFVATLWIFVANAHILGLPLTAACLGIIFGSFIILFMVALKSWERDQMRKHNYVEVRAIDELYTVLRKHGISKSKKSGDDNDTNSA